MLQADCMKLPAWFGMGTAIWLVFGLPAYFQTPYEDRSITANLTWLAAVSLVYLPLILLAVFGVFNLVHNKRSRS